MSTLRITDFPIGFRGLTFNGHRTTAGAPSGTESAHKDTIVVDVFDFSPVQVRDQREALHALTGGDFGSGNEVFRYVTIGGKIKSTTGEKLEDAIAKIVRAGSIGEAMLDYPTTMGASALDFYCPTEVSATGIATPVREKFLVRPVGPAGWTERMHEGLSCRFSLSLVAADPRRMLYTATSVTFSAGAGWTQALPNWTTTQGYKVYPVITVVLSGAGHASMTFSDGTTDLVCDFSAETAGTFTIDMGTQRIAKSTTGKAYIRTSGVNTYWGIPAGGVAAAAVTNRTNVTSVTFAYNQSRA
jgi:hypothetical protein